MIERCPHTINFTVSGDGSITCNDCGELVKNKQHLVKAVKVIQRPIPDSLLRILRIPIPSEKGNGEKEK